MVWDSPTVCLYPIRCPRIAEPILLASDVSGSSSWVTRATFSLQSMQRTSYGMVHSPFFTMVIPSTARTAASHRFCLHDGHIPMNDGLCGQLGGWYSACVGLGIVFLSKHYALSPRWCQEPLSGLLFRHLFCILRGLFNLLLGPPFDGLHR